MEFFENRVRNKAHLKRMIELAKQEETTVFIWGTGLLGTGKGYEIISRNNIQVDFYCDNNKEKQGQVIKNNIKCVAPDQMLKYEKVVCIVLIGVHGVVEVVQTLEKWGIENYITYEELISDSSFLKEYFPFMEKPQIAIYTCISGGYDNLLEPMYISEDCDYFCISDQKISEQSVYKWLDINDYLPNEELDNTRKNRYCKINSHKIFPDYKYTIYIDGDTEIINDISMCISDIGRCGVAARGKTSCMCLYFEALRCIEAQKDNRDIITKQIERYYQEGMPRYFGSFACGVLVREHMTDKCIKLMEDWWMEVKEGSKRDQISFPYVLWKNGYTAEDVGTIVDNPFGDNIFWKYHYGHKR